MTNTQQLKRLLHAIKELESMTTEERSLVLRYFMPKSKRTFIATTKTIDRDNNIPVNIVHRVRKGKQRKYTPEEDRRILEYGDSCSRKNGRIVRGAWAVLAREMGNVKSNPIASRYSFLSNKRKAQ